jgi:CelD/BcsL family acetyltransferase involved in cellulose biosynthesis
MPADMGDPEIVVAAFPDFGALAQEWRALEQRAAGFSFFQSWTWLGCLAAERFPAPLLVRAERGGRTLGLALLNRRDGALHLSESGEAERDAIYVEHNAPLLAADAPAGLAGRMLAACWTVSGVRRLLLSGAPAPLPAEAGGLVLSDRRLPAPFVDLAAVTRGGTDFLGSRSGNTRAQLRRSFRHFSGLGPVMLERPEGEGTALAWLDEMIGLHAAAWGRRGRPGAFAGAFMRRFHAALVAAALPRGELDLLRIAAGRETLGFLYGFRHRGIVYAYQSGFRTFPGQPDARPGLVGHALAIEEARQAGLARYDFLAGDARYKRSLATGEAQLAWAELVRPGLAGRLQVGASRMLAGLRGRLARGLSSVRAAGSGDRPPSPAPPAPPSSRAAGG